MKRGISLAEMLICLVISSLLLISMFKAFNTFTSILFSFTENVKSSLAIFRTLDTLERDLNLSIGNFSCGETFVAFDIVFDGERKRIRYYISGNRIVRRSGNSYNTVMEFMQSAKFCVEKDSIRFAIDGKELLFGLDGGEE